MKAYIQNNKIKSEKDYHSTFTTEIKKVEKSKKKSNFGKYTLFAFLIAVISIFSNPSILQAQVSVGADIVNRYVWRGFDFGNALNIQPSISYTKGGFELGTWAAYSVDDALSDEHDLWIGYSFDLGNGSSLGIGATDYYFPALGTFFDYDGAGDGNAAHWIEPYLAFTGPETFPISIWASIIATNDIEADGDKATPLYLEASYPFSVQDTDLSITTGLITSESANFYGVNQAAVTNLSISAGRDIKISDSFSIPVSASYILNPFSEISYLVFGISL